MNLRIGVVGAGAFGRGIAQASARHGHEVVLWSRQDRELPEPIRTSTDIAAMGDCELIFVAVPARHAANVAEHLGEVVDGRHLIIHVSRGLIGAELKTTPRSFATRRCAAESAHSQARSRQTRWPKDGQVARFSELAFRS